MDEAQNRYLAVGTIGVIMDTASHIEVTVGEPDPGVTVLGDPRLPLSYNDERHSSSIAETARSLAFVDERLAVDLLVAAPPQYQPTD